MMGIIINAINALIRGLVDFINVILSILPDSPFSNFEVSGLEFLGELNWILPVDNMVMLTGYWLLAIAAYYLYSTALRWAKAIQ